MTKEKTGITGALSPPMLWLFYDLRLKNGEPKVPYPAVSLTFTGRFSADFSGVLSPRPVSVGRVAAFPVRFANADMLCALAAIRATWEVGIKNGAGYFLDIVYEIAGFEDNVSCYALYSTDSDDFAPGVHIPEHVSYRVINGSRHVIYTSSVTLLPFETNRGALT